MGFYLILKGRSQRKPWRLQYRERVNGREVTREIRETDYRRLGFSAQMSIEQARERKDSLNSLKEVRRIESRRAEIDRRIEDEETALNAFLTASDVLEFEDSVLFAKKDNPKKRSAWLAAKRCLAELKLEPREYAVKSAMFYGYFIRLKWSLGWAQKVIDLINRWGEFQAMRQEFYFKKLPRPTGQDAFDLSDAYFERSPKGRASEPLTPELLESKRSEIPERWYNWLFLSVWFGLRPIEIDRLLSSPGPRTWSIAEANTLDGKRLKVLRIYQSKLVNTPHEKRLKQIPILTKEQEKALKIVEGQNFKRPSHPRHLQKHFGEQVYLYGGRKNFSRLMRSLGQDQIDYSRWLGHQRPQQTESAYEEKLVLNVNPIKRK